MSTDKKVIRVEKGVSEIELLIARLQSAADGVRKSDNPDAYVYVHIDCENETAVHIRVSK